MHVLYTHIYKVIHNQKCKKLTEWRHGDFDKQTDSSGHILIHSALGRWTAAQICPALIHGIWVALQTQQQTFPLLSSSLFSLPYSSEACPGGGKRGSAASWYGQEPLQSSFFPCLPLGAICWLRGKVVARWDPTCPLGKMICKFGNVGSFAAVWSCLIGPDWRLIWLA